MADKQEIKGQEKLTILGPITEAYGCDPKALCEKLNVLRGGELAAELQYRHHAFMAVSMAMPGVKEEFLEHAAQEAKHADMLGERISQLGGDPVFEPSQIAQSVDQMRLELGDPKTLDEMVRYNYEVERRQIVAYTQLIRDVAFDDPTTRRILEDILIDTEHHAAELGDLLSRKAH